MVSLIEAAQVIVGGKWEEFDLGAQTCVRADDKRGATQAASRIGPGMPISKQAEILDAVESDWTRRGYAPVRSTRPVIRGVAVTRLVVKRDTAESAGLFVEFEIADTASSVDARSRCIDADPYEINGGDDADLFEGD